MSQSKMSSAAALATGLAILHAGLSFVVPRGAATAPRMPTSTSMADLDESAAGFGVAGTACVALVAAGAVVAGARALVARKALHGIKMPYSLQKDAYADLEFLNDVGYLPDGTPMNRAGNAVNHPETIGPDPHVDGSPLPRAEFCNSVGYLPDGTALNAAGNAMNHPETMGPDLHVNGSPLPASHYYADVGYLVDGTDLLWAGNNSVKAGAPIPPSPSSPAPAMAPPVMAGGASMGGDVRSNNGFLYAVQKDAYVDLNFFNDVGYLCDGTPMNTAGNNLNHPENIGPDPHVAGSPLPRALFVNDVGYLPDGTPMNQAGNAINHPETIGPDPHVAGSPLPTSAYAADIGYLVDGTPIDAAGNNAVH